MIESPLSVESLSSAVIVIVDPLLVAEYPELDELAFIAFFTAVAVPLFPPVCETFPESILTPATLIAEIVFIEVSSPPCKLPAVADAVDAPVL